MMAAYAREIQYRDREENGCDLVIFYMHKQWALVTDWIWGLSMRELFRKLDSGNIP